jgi:putative addiction module component (TIGR02574 family)
MDKSTTIQTISTWPIDDQIDLVQQVWQGIVASGWQPELSVEQRAELDRRLDALDANPHDVVSWNDIVNHVRRRR